MEAQSPLAALRDIQLPEVGSWWPPAIGWWLLAGLIALVFALIGWLGRRHWQRHRARRQVIKALLDVDVHSDQIAAIQEMSRLVRRFAISEFGRHRAARLQGAEWLAFLDDAVPMNSYFQAGDGRCLESAPYQRKPRIDLAELRQQLVVWCKKASKKK